MCVTAMRAASNAVAKQSAGDCAAMTGIGDSAWRPNRACSRSACSVLVGKSGGRPAALDVDDHQRQLGHDREAHASRP